MSACEEWFEDCGGGGTREMRLPHRDCLGMMKEEMEGKEKKGGPSLGSVEGTIEPSGT